MYQIKIKQEMEIEVITAEDELGDHCDSITQLFAAGDVIVGEPVRDNGDSFDIQLEDGSKIYALHGCYFELLGEI